MITAKKIDNERELIDLTNIKIIEIARQAGARPSSNSDEYDVLKITNRDLEAFAKLVVTKFKEKNK